MKNIDIPNWAIYGILFIAAFLFVFLFSCTTSPLYEHYPFWFHGDSGIFQEMGICLLQGGIPYVDLFDHKGPILWFIQALGIWLSPRWGLLALQTISLFCTILLWYKSIYLIIEKQLLSIFIILFCLFFLLAFYERGNLCEEWSLPFISLPIHIFIKRWRATTNAQTLTSIFIHSDTFIIGLCVGIISMIRINNTAPIIGFVLWHFIKCIQLKDYNRLWKDIVIICSGMAIIFSLCASFYLFIADWNGVYEMIYGTFIFNYLYLFGDVGSRLPFNVKLLHYTPSIGFITILLILIFLYRKKEIVTTTLISYCATLLSIGRFGYGHYMIILVPLFVVTISLIVHCKNNWIKLLFITTIVLSIKLLHDPVDRLAVRVLRRNTDTEIFDGFHRFVKSLPQAQQHSIYNENLIYVGSCLFAEETIYQCNRIMIPYHIDISSRLQKYKSVHGIKELKPIWVLTQGPRPETTDEYMAMHYTLADSIPGGQFDPIWCWKRNEK